MSIPGPSGECSCGHTDSRCEENKLTTSTPTRSTNSKEKFIHKGCHPLRQELLQMNEKSKKEEQLCESDDNYDMLRIPDHLLHYLFSKLSSKCLAKCKTVSKDFKRIVEDPEFVKYRKQNGLMEPRILVVPENPNESMARAYHPADDKWFDGPPLPGYTKGEVHEAFACVSVGSCLFILGGSRRPANLPSESGRICGDVWKYDATTNSWSKMQEMNPPRRLFAASRIGTKIYVAGGQTSAAILKTAQVYDTVENKWEDIPDLGCQRLGCRQLPSVTLNEELWIIGGRFEQHNTESDGSEFETDFAEVYNPVTKNWRLVYQSHRRPYQAQQDPDHDDLSRDMQVEGPLVVAGGKLLCLQNKKVWQYDQVTTKWTPVGDGPGGAGHDSGFVSVGNQIYVIGGRPHRPALQTLDTVEVGEIRELQTLSGVDKRQTDLSWRKASPMGFNHGKILGVDVVLV
ncbi:hypothetical protein R1flu_021275 [Riccia fluitans]|uniref:F-box domain-containing protein n=1 Tax=Riccia fluitans TaxID=41844 RepID=A0ABD1ZNW5_9MARC